tara:strand:- start:136 stop:450 length:315 start_codon:yes stop_codon:yes gene_type:complete
MKYIFDIESKNLSIFGKDVIDEDANLSVHYVVDLDAREWGIKDITIFVVKISGTLIITKDNENWTDIDLSNFIIDTEISNNLKEGIYPAYVDIDLDEKKIQVNF